MNKITLGISTFLSVFSAFSQNNFQIHGHRGARGLMPENTVPAFCEGAKYGVDYVELDVVITKDNQVLVSHEPWMRAEICEGVNIENPQKYNIHNMTLAEVQAFDCGSKYVPKFPEQKKIKITKPLLSEVIDSLQIYCTKNGLNCPKINVEIKCWQAKDGIFQPDPKTFVELVYNVLKEKSFLNHVMIQSFDLRVLQEWQKIDSVTPKGLLIANLKSVNANIKALGFTPAWYNPYYKLVSAKTVKAAHSLGMLIVPWTVNSIDEMTKLKALGVDGIITDYPNIALTLKK